MECLHRCGEKFTTSEEIAEHIGPTGNCPLAPVPCLFGSVGKNGCPAQVQRRFYDSHLTRSSGVHQRLLLEQVREVSERQAELAKDVERLAAKPETTETSHGDGNTDQEHYITKGEVTAQLASVGMAITDLSSDLERTDKKLSEIHSQVSNQERSIQQMRLAAKTSANESTQSSVPCSRCDGLERQLHTLQGMVMTMISQPNPVTKWLVNIEVRMHADGRLELCTPVSSAAHWSGPAQCGHQVYTSTVLRSLTQLISPRVAASQVGSLDVAVNVIKSTSDWPSGMQQLRVTYPNTALSLTESTILSLLAAPPQPVAGASVQRSKPATLATLGIAILLPPEAELGAILEWSFEVELCIAWACTQ